MSDDEIFHLVEEKINLHQPQAYKLTVDRSSLSRSGSWWQVVVVPSDPDIRAYDYNQIMNVVEDEIERQAHINVLLVPALVDG